LAGALEAALTGAFAATLGADLGATLAAGFTAEPLETGALDLEDDLALGALFLRGAVDLEVLAAGRTL